MKVTRTTGMLSTHIEAAKGKVLVVVGEDLFSACKAMDVLPGFDLRNIREVAYNETTGEIALNKNDVGFFKKRGML